MEPAVYDELIEQRTQRADEYHARTRSQLDWYGDKARANKLCFQFIGISIIVLGAVVDTAAFA